MGKIIILFESGVFGTMSFLHNHMEAWTEIPSAPKAPGTPKAPVTPKAPNYQRNFVKLIIVIRRSQQLREEGGNPPHHPIQPCSELARYLTGSLYVRRIRTRAPLSQTMLL